MSIGQYNIYQQLTSVRVLSLDNITGVYDNGPFLNGIKSTFTIAADSLTIDSVLLNVGDRVLLDAQNDPGQNGIYIVSSIDTTVVLERSADFQCVEQMVGGQYVLVGDGALNSGALLVLVEPLPNNIGVDAISFVVVIGGENAGGIVRGSFVATLSGAIPSNPTGVIIYQKTGQIVTLSIPNITGSVSVDTPLIISAFPSIIAPTEIQECPVIVISATNFSMGKLILPVGPNPGTLAYNLDNDNFPLATGGFGTNNSFGRLSVVYSLA